MHLCHTLPQVSSSTIKIQYSFLKLIQGPDVITGKQDNKYGSLEFGVDHKTVKKFGGVLKEMQVMINQYQNIISVPMTL